MKFLEVDLFITFISANKMAEKSINIYINLDIIILGLFLPNSLLSIINIIYYNVEAYHQYKY